MKKLGQIVFIDDDEVNNMVCERIVKRTLGSIANVFSFTSSEEGLSHLKNETVLMEKGAYTLLFLDINMPVLTGWDVLQRIEQMDDKIKNKLLLFMLSSSIDPDDIRKATENKLVSDFIEKPLSFVSLFHIMEKHFTPKIEIKV